MSARNGRGEQKAGKFVDRLLDDQLLEQRLSGVRPGGCRSDSGRGLLADGELAYFGRRRGRKFGLEVLVLNGIGARRDGSGYVAVGSSSSKRRPGKSGLPPAAEATLLVALISAL
jgi:hypothetical protein